MPVLKPIKVLVVAISLMTLPAPVWAEVDIAQLPIKEQWEITIGGRLYDAWYSELEKDKPGSTHPSYPAKGKGEGASTWRCKECHGWDYQGKDGAYRKGSHFTGIKGIQNQDGKSLRRITRLLRNKAHGYTKDMIPDRELDYLAQFISKGQKDFSNALNPDGTPKAADMNRGKYLYGVICEKCHGMDGTYLNFGDKDDPEFVGTVAIKNPQELLHKVRFGQPGTGMISYGEFFERVAMEDMMGDSDWMSVLAHTQTLPTKISAQRMEDMTNPIPGHQGEHN